MRKGLIVLLSLGVVVGFGSGVARLAHHGGGCHERWHGRYAHQGRSAAAPAPAAPAPVYIVIPSAVAQAPMVVNVAPAPLAVPGVNPQPTQGAQ